MTTEAASATLDRQMNALCDPYPFHVGWYFKNLVTGEAADRNGHVIIPSASTRKIAILMAALKAVNEGKVDLDQSIQFEAEYQNNQSGCFYHFQPDLTLPFRDALIMMIIVSDNTSTGKITDMVGLDYINDFSRSIGMKNTTHRFGNPVLDIKRDDTLNWTNSTTPADVGLLLELVVEGTTCEEAAAKLGITPELCRYAIDIMSWQKLRCRLPAYLPPKTKVAHKTGTDSAQIQYLNDTGIVFKNETPIFILTVYNDRIPAELPDGTPGHTAATQLIGRLCRICWDTFE